MTMGRKRRVSLFVCGTGVEAAYTEARNNNTYEGTHKNIYEGIYTNTNIYEAIYTRATGEKDPASRRCRGQRADLQTFKAGSERMWHL